MTTWTIVTTGVPSTGVAQPSDQEIFTCPRSSLPPGAIVGIALAILGVMAFAVFWIFCANRRRRLNTPQREADGLPAHNSVTRTLLDDEMNGTGSEGLEKPGRVMEERFAGILDAHRMVSDPIDNKYHGVQLNDSAQRVARTSHTLLQRELSLSPPHHFQSPPSAYVPPRFKSASARRTDPPESEASAWLGEYSIVHSTSSNLRHPSDITTIDAGGLDSPSSHAQPHHALEQGSAEGILPSSSIFPTTSPMSSTFPPPPPPPAYVPSVTGERVQRRASPGPDAAAWFGGYSIAHWSGSNSHSNPHSHPSEELPVSGRVTSVSSQAHSYGTGLGSAFSSHEGSLYGRALRIRSSSHGSSNGPLLSASSHAASSQGPPNSPSRRSSSGERRRSMASVPPTSYGGKRKRRSSDVDDRIGGHRSRHGSSSGSGDERSVGSIRAFLGRLRGGRDGTSRQFDGGSGTFGQSLASTVAMEERRQRETAERLEEERVRQQYRQTARGREPVYSFILSNPDSQPPSPSIRSTNSTHMNSGLSPNESQYHPLRPWTGQHPHNSDASLPFDTWPLWLSPHELPEGSRNAEDLLDPRLRLNDAAIGQEGRSLASLRDFLDYSRPIGAIMSNRLHSVTTFGTQETRGSRSVSAQASLGDLAAGDAHVTINSLD
ncbi:hypothetical protein BV22DRAFT_700644 [Leucogyrophana mollusca]|uniref:Uncharacterized protein n=1 Tax=Leucogyrophana mollusca TaxID=85980 RepID=A0ACB8B9F7_9AGAM|nr:hypothetical protein BV22DRAFT_700644 [Leucogyrophana mollusca]